MRDLNGETWVEEVVERAGRLNIDTLAFDIYHGGYAIFEGALGPRAPEAQDFDILRLLERETSRRGMRLVAMSMGAHCANFMAQEHPTWHVRAVDGTPQVFEQTNLLCLNSPYANYLLQEFGELLDRYTLDGIYIEGLYGLDCYCVYCRTEFAVTHDRPLPEGANRADDQEYRQFRADVITNFVRRLRDVIDDHSPETVLMPCPSMLYRTYADLEAWGPYADAITLERPWGYERTGGIGLSPPIKPLEIGMGMQIVQALSGRPAVGTIWLSWAVDHDYSASTNEHYRFNAAEVLLHGATPQLHAQTVFDLHASGTEVVRETFELVEEMRPAMLDTRPYAYAGIVLDWSEFEPSSHFRGLYQALQERHVPFEIVPLSAVARPDLLAHLDVLVLPNVARLSDGHIQGIRAMHARGGGVVSTFRTGLSQPNGGIRRCLPLGDLTGAHGPFGIVTSPPGSDWGSLGRPYLSGVEAGLLRLNYFRVSASHDGGYPAAGELQSFHGSYVEIQAKGGEVAAWLHDYDYSKMRRHHPVTGWYPGRAVSPLIVAKQNEGAGRAVYITGELDRAAWETGLPGAIDILAHSVRWAAGKSPAIVVDCPPTVAVAIHEAMDGSHIVVNLGNRTTNPLLDVDPVVSYIHPVHGVSIRIEDPERVLRGARALGGDSLTISEGTSGSIVSVGALNAFQSVILEFESAR
jgi:hypothetical protein